MFIRKVSPAAYIAVSALLLSWLALPAHADEVTTKGTVLRGTVVGFTSSGIELDTEYGKGSVVISFDDVEDVETEGRYYVLHSDDGETSGRLLGMKDGQLLVGEDPSSAQPVQPADILMVYTADSYEQTGLGWIRRQLPLWRGNFDVGFSLTQSTTDSSALSIAFGADRKKRPTRFTINAGYRYGTQKEKHESRSTTENEILGKVRGEYDLTKKIFTFGSADAEYDEIESLSIRTVPQAGLGYRFWEEGSDLFQLEVGGAYVYERYFGGDTNKSFSIVFGKLLELGLPFGSTFHWRTDFLPAVDDFTGDYLLRTEASLAVPMLEYLQMKLTVADTYDSTPAEDSDHNQLTTTAGLSVVF